MGWSLRHEDKVTRKRARAEGTKRRTSSLGKSPLFESRQIQLAVSVQINSEVSEFCGPIEPDLQTLLLGTVRARPGAGVNSTKAHLHHLIRCSRSLNRQTSTLRAIAIAFLLSSAIATQAQVGSAAKQSPIGNFSKVGGLLISADSSYRDNDNDTVEMSGNVQVIYGDRHLRADFVSVSLRSRGLDARGRVHYTSPIATVIAERAMLDLDRDTGLIINGYVQSGQVLFEGEVLEKLSETSYEAAGARYTTCDNCPESWSFSGSRIRAELGGYAYIKNSVLRIGGVPLFWLPYLVVPLKSDRQSGFLTPVFESSDSGGKVYSQSYFWAIDRSQDATLTLMTYELRGQKALTNYRYVLDAESSGEFDFGYMTDRVLPRQLAEIDARFNRTPSAEARSLFVNRWFLRYSHFYQLPSGWVHRAQLNNASDLLYSRDFPLETGINGDPAMENRTSLTRATESHLWMMDASYYINFLQNDPLESNNDSVHRLPELRLASSWKPVAKTGFLYNFDLNSTNFVRPGPTTDTLTIDNQSIDFRRTGLRLDGTFSLMRPLALGRLDLTPRLSYRETQYRFQENPYRNTGGSGFATESNQFPQNTRRYIRADINLQTKFSRIFRPDQEDRFRHEIVPEVTATALPWIDHPYHPFFGRSAPSEIPYFAQSNISDADLTSPYGLQFDYTDRILERKLVSYGITNKLTERVSSPSGKVNYRQFLTWRVAQTYDIAQQESDLVGKQPYSDILSDLIVTRDRLQLYQTLNHFPYQSVTNQSTRMRYSDLVGDFAEVGYSQSYNIAANQTVRINERKEEVSLSVKKSVSVFDLVGKVGFDLNPPDNRRDNVPASYGYALQLRLPGECWYFYILQYRTAGGDNKFRFSFDFSFDGKKKPPLSESIFELFGF